MSHLFNTRHPGPVASRALPFAVFTAYTAVAAVTAAAAASMAVAFALPLWAMFIGWVAFFTRGFNGSGVKDGLANLACVLLGIVVGTGASLALAALGPSLGVFTLPFVVFTVAMLVVSLRAIPVLNNILCYFLGLISYFASHLEPSVAAFTQLGSAGALGSLAGLIALQLQRRLPKAS